MALTLKFESTDSLARITDVVSSDLRAALPVPAEYLQVSQGSRRFVFVNRYFYPDVSATSQMLFDLSTRLAEQGNEVHVVCSDQLYDDPSARLAARDTVRGVHVHRIWTSHFGRQHLAGRSIDYASFYVTASAKLWRLLGRGDTVVAKTDPPLISVVAAAIAKLRGARLVNWVQDVFPEVAAHLGMGVLPEWIERKLRRLRDYSLSAAHTNVVLGTRMREHLEQQHIPRSQIRIIENWADGDAVTPKPADNCQLRMQLGLVNKFVVAYSGNLGRAHEFETLLDAAERLRGDADTVFLMIGGGAKMRQLQASVEAKGLQNFRFLPYQPREHLSDSLAAADVHLACLLPQLEGLIVPSKFYGILAAGRPTIFIGDTDGELSRIINSTRCGALVDAIRRMQADPLARAQMGSRARTLFVERYTVGRATRQWLEALQSV